MSDNSNETYSVDDICKKLNAIEKKLDKLLNINTRVAKALHLLPVTEKEEREIQIQQRTNLKLAADISYALDEMQNKNQVSDNGSLTEFVKDVYIDVIGEDFLAGGDRS